MIRFSEESGLEPWLAALWWRCALNEVMTVSSGGSVPVQSCPRCLCSRNQSLCCGVHQAPLHAWVAAEDAEDAYVPEVLPIDIIYRIGSLSPPPRSAPHLPSPQPHPRPRDSLLSRPPSSSLVLPTPSLLHRYRLTAYGSATRLPAVWRSPAG